MNKKPTADQMLETVYWLIYADVLDNAEGDVRAVAEWLVAEARMQTARKAVNARAKELKAENKRFAASHETVARQNAQYMDLTFSRPLINDMFREANMPLEPAEA